MGKICGKVSSVPGVKERRSDRKSGDKGEDESVCVCEEMRIMWTDKSESCQKFLGHSF